MLSCLANLRALLRCETFRIHYGRGIVYLQIEREIPLSQIGKLGRVQESERTPKSETEGDHTGAMASAANANETGGRDGTGVRFARAPGFSPPGDSKFSVSRRLTHPPTPCTEGRSDVRSGCAKRKRHSACFRWRSNICVCFSQSNVCADRRGGGSPAREPAVLV